MKKSLKFRVSSVLSVWGFCFVIYLLLSWSLSAQELVIGGAVSLLVALFSARFMVRRAPGYMFHPKRILWYLYYLVILFPKELFRANWEMTKRVLKKDLDIRPGIVRVKTDMTSDYGLMMLSNAITLTPGTITMEIAAAEDTGENYMYIHCVDVPDAQDETERARIIKGALENGLSRIWE